MAGTTSRVAIPAVLLAATVGVAMPSCIIPDKGIVVPESGTNWCVTMVNAVGEQYVGLDDTGGSLGYELVEIKNEHDNWLSVCHCFSNEDVDYIKGRVEARDFDDDLFVLLLDTLGVEARAQCFERAEALGLDRNNCNEAFDALDVETDFYYGPPDACSRAGEWNGSSGDGGSDDGLGSLPDLATVVSCEGNACTVDASFVDDLIANPWVVQQGGTRLVATAAPVVGFAFQGVAPGSLAFELGFRNGDVPVMVNQLPLATLDHVLSAHSLLRDSTTIEVTVARQDDSSWSNVILTFDIE